MIGLIDLHHQGVDRSIGCYVLDTDDGPALFDCGPSTTIDALESGLAEEGQGSSRRRHEQGDSLHPAHAYLLFSVCGEDSRRVQRPRNQPVRTSEERRP